MNKTDRVCHLPNPLASKFVIRRRRCLPSSSPKFGVRPVERDEFVTQTWRLPWGEGREKNSSPKLGVCLLERGEKRIRHWEEKILSTRMKRHERH